MSLATVFASVPGWFVGLLLMGVGLAYIPIRRMLWKRTLASTILPSYPRDSRRDWALMLHELGVWWPCAPIPTAFLRAELVRLRANRVLLGLGVGASAIFMTGLVLIFPIWGSPGSPIFWLSLSVYMVINVLMGRRRENRYRRHLEIVLADRSGEVIEPPFDLDRDL